METLLLRMQSTEQQEEEELHDSTREKYKTAIVKQKNRIKELEDVETKLKRLLQMAKRSIENSKQELAEKEIVIESLKQQLGSKEDVVPQDQIPRGYEARSILQYVLVDEEVWCLIEFAPDLESTTSSEETIEQWKRFSCDQEVEDFVRKVTGEPLVIPPCSLTPEQADQIRQETKTQIDRVQEEFRRYRVRAEISRKQKDAEIQKLTTSSVTKHQERIAGQDLENDLSHAKDQIQQLNKFKKRMEQEEQSWREQVEKLQRENDSLRGSAGETAMAVQWRERYEHAMKEKETLMQLQKQHSTGLSTDESEEEKYQQMYNKLKKEYTMYRKRALQVVEEKELLLSEAQKKLTASGIAFEYRGLGARRRPSLEADQDSARRSAAASLEGTAATTDEYLKNIVLKYMSAEQPEVKDHMEKAIATVLKFTPTEIAAVEEKRKQSQQWIAQWNLW